MMERKLLNLQSNESLSLTKNEPLLRVDMTFIHESNGSLSARDKILPDIDINNDKEYISSLSARSKYDKNRSSKVSTLSKKISFQTNKVDLSDTLDSMITNKNNLMIFQEEKIDDINYIKLHSLQNNNNNNNNHHHTNNHNNNNTQSVVIVGLESSITSQQQQQQQQKKNKSPISSPKETKETIFSNNPNAHSHISPTSPPSNIIQSSKNQQQKAFPKGRILKQYDDSYDILHHSYHDKYNIRPTRIQKPMPGNTIIQQKNYIYQHINNNNNETSISKALPIRFKIKPYSSNPSRKRQYKDPSTIKSKDQDIIDNNKKNIDNNTGDILEAHVDSNNSNKTIKDEKIHVNINMHTIIPVAVYKNENEVIEVDEIFPKDHLLDDVKIHESLRPRDKSLDTSNQQVLGTNSPTVTNKSKPMTLIPLLVKQQELIIPTKPVQLNPVAARLFNTHQYNHHRGTIIPTTTTTYQTKGKVPLQSRIPSQGGGSGVSTRNNTIHSSNYYIDSSENMINKIKTTFMMDPFSKTQTLATVGGLFKLDSTMQSDFNELIHNSNAVVENIMEDTFKDDLANIISNNYPVVAISNYDIIDDLNDIQNKNNIIKLSIPAMEIIQASQIKPLEPIQFSENQSWLETLTPLEQIEIFQYPHIYFTGRNIDLKIRTHYELNNKETIDTLSILDNQNLKENLEEHSFNNQYITVQDTIQNSTVMYHTDKGNYKVSIGDHISYQYDIIQLLGTGSFGDVYKCYDYKHLKHVAIKIIKNKKHFIDSSKQEKKILEFVHNNGNTDNICIIKLIEAIEFREHPCFIFPIYGKNLYEYLQHKNFQGLPISFIKKVTIQLLKALEYIHKLGIIHCDLKPENILMNDENQCSIVLVDFGSSCFINETTFTYLQSRFYRAPEILLGLPYGTEIDIWSMACILTELRSGYPAFPGESNSDQISCITEILGMPNNEIYERSKRQSEHFNNDKQLIIKNSPRGKSRIPLSRTIKQLINARNKDEDFVDFLNQCFTWLPDHRLNACNALNHNWLYNKKQINISNDINSIEINNIIKDTSLIVDIVNEEEEIYVNS